MHFVGYNETREYGKSTSMTQSRFPRYAWGLLLYNLAVILWGVYVRASFSGDGCGAHWPTCGGQVIPLNGQTKMVVEFIHRLSSGLALLLVCVLFVWAFRAYPKRHRVRLGATLAVCFTFSEALVGAGLVLFKLVAHNPSAYRALAISTHLTNTFLLLAALTLTGWWASGGGELHLRRQGMALYALLAGMAGTLILGITGTLAALGDTLYPATDLIAGLKEDFSPTASYLIHLRPLHPVVALVVGIYLVTLVSVLAKQRPSRSTRRFAHWMVIIFLAQFGVGFVNLMLHAPIWLQIEHLMIADLLWITLILFSAAALVVESETMDHSLESYPYKGLAHL